MVTEASAVPNVEAHIKIVDQEEKLQKQKKTMPEARAVVNVEVNVKSSTPTSRSRSSNRFSILDTVKDVALNSDLCNQEDEMKNREEVIEARKVRVASVGAAKLMKSLKPKKKGPIDKGKIKQLKTGFSVSGGQLSSSSSSSL